VLCPPVFKTLSWVSAGSIDYLPRPGRPDLRNKPYKGEKAAAGVKNLRLVDAYVLVVKKVRVKEGKLIVAFVKRVQEPVDRKISKLGT
jgi:hypothetical protein